MRILHTSDAKSLLRRLENRSALHGQAVEPVARRIVTDVRCNGDRALRKYARNLDGLAPSQPMRVSRKETTEAWNSSPLDFRDALRFATANVRQFAEWQCPKKWRRTIAPGVSVGQMVLPLDSVGCYVPGGRYPLPSTLLMTVIPAQVAGVKRIVVVSPRPAPETLAAAAMLGIDEFYRVGGAQAIAALAYGTASLARVDKIVGPGNFYVTSAKKIVAFDCAIDFLAGPTEVLIVSHNGNARFIASDLVAQAEHDPDALPIFITSSAELAAAVAAQVKQQAGNNEIARQSLRKNGIVLITKSREEALDIANAIAPEHLTVEADDVPQVRSAGSVFVGAYSPQSVGDYCSGPNHVLPTGGMARVRGGLSVLDFVKLISVQQVSRAGLRGLSDAVTRLAEAEGLHAHADSVRVRYGHA
jgi:histidinol dehydrogenase